MDQKDIEFRQRLLATFRIEAEEHLQAISAGLLELEKRPSAAREAEIVETVYREAHSLKGAARSVDLTKAESLCQSLESVLAALKRQALAPTPSLLDLLHDAVNLLDRLLVPGDGEASAPDDTQLGDAVRRIEATLSGMAPPARPEPPRPQPPPPMPAPALVAVPTSPTVEPAAVQPALFDRPTSSETVRIATAKLDAILIQAEELISAKLTAGQRTADLRRTSDTLAAWKADWLRLYSDAQAVQTALEGLSNGGRRPGEAGLKGSQVTRLVKFLEQNDHHLRLLADEMAAMVKSAEQDRRALSRTVDDLLEEMKKALVLPFSTVLELMPKLVRDLARDQGKDVALTIQGGETEVDRRILEEMKDPFIHLVRNSVDHGLEKPQERARRGKPQQGRLTITISPVDNNRVQILVADDGAGVDVARVRTAAVQARAVSPMAARQMSEQELLALVFQSGISTSSVLTDLSGRGLGLAIVYQKVEKLGGVITVDTRPGAGTTFRIVLPLSLATFRGVLVRVEESLYVLPTIQVERVMRVNVADIKTIEGRETVMAGGRAAPLIDLGEVLELDRRTSRHGRAESLLVVVVGSGDRAIAFQVDDVVGEQEVLVKNLGKPLSRVRNSAGATVLGTGKVVPILNVSDLAKSAAALAAPAASVPAAAPGEEALPKLKRLLVAEDSITARSLLKGILEGAGYDVRTAVDGADAFVQLRTGEFDLVVSDVDMPRLSGFELTAKIRADKRLAEVPVVLVTALASSEDRERGVDVGANAYIVKSSFDQSNLLEVIRRLI